MTDARPGGSPVLLPGGRPDAARRHDGPSLAARLFLAMGLVVAAGVVTLLLVSLLVAPLVFANHLEAAGVSFDDVVAQHVREGFDTAVLTAVAAGTLAAVAVAVAVAAFVARRVGRPVTEAARTATRLAEGDRDARMSEPSMGPELAGLASAMNALGDRLAETEARRQALLTDVAHELRTPLAALEATVEAISDGVLPADPATLAGLRAQTQRLATLTHDLAAVSRSEEHAFSLVPAVVPLRSLVDQAVATHAARYAVAGVALTADGPEVAAYADPDRVLEVLGQLLDNALRHCRPGDRVSLTTSRADGLARLVVADTGLGFPAEDAERIFDRFHRGAVPSDTGSGVGLTIARRLVEAQHGTLVASSDGPGSGSVFTVSLPTA